MFRQVFLGYFKLQCVHRGIRLYRGRIDGLRMAAYHAFFNTKAQDPCKDFLENGFGEKLPGTAYGTVPGQLLVDIVTYKVEDVQPHRTVGDQLAVTDDVFQIADQAKLEEND